jgi:hypothetical protein
MAWSEIMSMLMGFYSLSRDVIIRPIANLLNSIMPGVLGQNFMVEIFRNNMLMATMRKYGYRMSIYVSQDALSNEGYFIKND